MHCIPLIPPFCVLEANNSPPFVFGFIKKIHGRQQEIKLAPGVDAGAGIWEILFEKSAKEYRWEFRDLAEDTQRCESSYWTPSLPAKPDRLSAASFTYYCGLFADLHGFLFTSGWIISLFPALQESSHLNIISFPFRQTRYYFGSGFYTGYLYRFYCLFGKDLLCIIET